MTARSLNKTTGSIDETHRSQSADIKVNCFILKNKKFNWFLFLE